MLNYWLVCQYVDSLSIYTMCKFEKPAYIEYTIIALWSLVIVEKFFLGLLLCSFYGPKMATSAYINIWSLICWGVFKKKKPTQKPRYSPVFNKLHIWSVSLACVTECVTRDDCLAITNWNCREQDRHCVDNLCVCARWATFFFL